MRARASLIAALALAYGAVPAADQPAASRVVFVCEHGNVKSLMAASYFNQLAAQRGLRLSAISRGSAPDSTTVPQPIAAALRTEGFDIGDFRPAKVEAAEVAEAVRIVTIGTDLPAGVRAEKRRVERWNDVPPAREPLHHLAEVKANIKEKYGIDLECIVNEAFQSCLKELRLFAAAQTAELQCPLLRLLQIEERLGVHVTRIAAKTFGADAFKATRGSNVALGVKG